MANHQANDKEDKESSTIKNSQLNVAGQEGIKKLTNPGPTISGSFYVPQSFQDSKDYLYISDIERYERFSKELTEQIKEDVDKRIAESNKQIKDNVDKKLKETGERVEVVKSDIQNTQIRAIETLGIFVALFTTVSVSFSAFESVEKDRIIPILLVLSGVMVLFVIVVDLMLKDIASRPNGKTSKDIFTVEIKGMAGILILIGFILIVFGVLFTIGL